MKTRIAVPFCSLAFCFRYRRRRLPIRCPPPQPQTVGLSKERLNRITETLKASIAKGDIPGAVLLISRHGKIAYFEAMGSLDPEKKTPMSKDAIFRIYSMTKPIADGCGDDAVRGGQARPERPGRQVHPRLQGREGWRGKAGRGRQAHPGPGRTEAGDDHPGPDAPQLRAHLRLLRRRPREEGLCRGQARRRRPDDGRVRGPARQAPARLPPGHDVGLQPVDRCARPGDRGRDRQAALSGAEGHAARPTRHDRHELLRDRSRQAGPHRRAVRQGPLDRRRCGRQRSAHRHEIQVRRRGPGGDGDGLRPLPADAGQRRQARRQALSEPLYDRLHGVKKKKKKKKRTTWATSSSAGPTT